MLSFSHAANPRAVIVKCDGCTYYADVDVEASPPYLHVFREILCDACFILLAIHMGLIWTLAHVNKIK